MGHGYEVVLTAHAAHHLAVVQAIGAGAAGQRDHHGGVEKPRIGALQGRELLLTVELVDEHDARHGEFPAVFVVHPIQGFVEAPGPHEETAVHDGAAVQTRAQAMMQDAIEILRDRQVCRNTDLGGHQDLSVRVAEPFSEYSASLEPVDIVPAQYGLDRRRIQEGMQGLCADVG